MMRHALLSDQFLTWSATNAKANHRRAQTTPQSVAAQVAASGRRSSGILDRTLQAVRQSQLQMRQRARTRPQVLPLRELSGLVASDGLRPSGRVRTGQREPGQLHADTGSPGADFRDQPRTVSSARAALRGFGEPEHSAAHRSHRSARWRSVVGQHADRPHRRRSRVHNLRGGQR